MSLWEALTPDEKAAWEKEGFTPSEAESWLRDDVLTPEAVYNWDPYSEWEG